MSAATCRRLPATAFEHTDGARLLGTLTVTYHTLCRVLGSPDEGDGHRVQVRWALIFEDGLVATIYDWRRAPRPPATIVDWQVGGKDATVFARVQRLLARGAPVASVPR